MSTDVLQSNKHILTMRGDTALTVMPTDGAIGRPMTAPWLDAHDAAVASRSGMTSWLLIVAIATLAIWVQWVGVPNHDVAWILTGAQRLLDGGRFGREVVDVNPPLAWWISMAPVVVAGKIGLTSLTAFLLAATGLCLASIALVDAVLRRSIEALPRRGFLLTACAAVLLLAPGYDFGQREHLLLVGTLPYIAAASVAAAGGRVPRGLGIVVGLMSGVGICLKPHFLLMPIAVEAWLLLRARRVSLNLRAETLVMATVGFLYVAAVWLWAPDYIRTVIPDAVAGYWAYENSLTDVVQRARDALLLLTLSFLFLAWLARERIWPPLAQALSVAAAGAALAAILQFKGWHYHFVPACGLAAMSCFVLFCIHGGVRAGLALCAVFVSIFGGSGMYFASVLSGTGTTDRVQSLTALFRTAGTERPVFAFITSPRDIHSAILLSGARWSGAACCVQQLPAAIRVGADRDKGGNIAARAAANRQLAGILRELEEEHPALILIDDRPSKLGFGNADFDYLAYLEGRPGFPALFTRYSERAPVAGFRVFALAQGAAASTAD